MAVIQLLYHTSQLFSFIKVRARSFNICNVFTCYSQLFKLQHACMQKLCSLTITMNIAYNNSMTIPLHGEFPFAVAEFPFAVAVQGRISPVYLFYYYIYSNYKEINSIGYTGSYC